MADDATFGVRQADTPTHQVDNTQITRGQTTVIRQRVDDGYQSGECLADQTGNGGVLTFTFSAVVSLVWVRSVGAVCRADPFGGMPSATQGVYCASDEPCPITVDCQVLKVYAPSGATVSVWGYRGA
jgi:hypothetical protein